MKFYDGDLQSGISLAVQEGKHVLCFVYDDSDESRYWETELLTDQWIPPGTLWHTVGLKIQAGSQEASFLSQICPISETPKILIIHQGKVLEQIGPGTEKEAFAERIVGAIVPGMPGSAVSDNSGPAVPPSETTDRLSTPQTQHDVSIQPGTSSTTASNSTSPATEGPSTRNIANKSTSASSSQSVQSTPAVNPSDTAANGPPSTNKGKGKAAPPLPPQPSTARPQPNQQANEAAAQRLRHKREAAQERNRILARVEADKIERRKQAEEARLARQGEEAQQQEEARSAQAAHSQTHPQSGRALRLGCALQIRQLDGSVLRSRFEGSDTLNAAVRNFIDEERSDGRTPYTFKEVRTPQPSRAVSSDEESQSLKDLGLGPSATLVLVPLHNVARAYEGPHGGITRPFKNAVATLVGFITAVWVTLVALVGSFFGLSTTPPSTARNPDSSSKSASASGSDAQKSSPSTTASSSSSNIRVHTLRNDSAPKTNEAGRRGRADGRKSKDDDPDQLYNGNTLNFEPKNERDDDEGGK